jgi:hypothetical protein
VLPLLGIAPNMAEQVEQAGTELVQQQEKPEGVHYMVGLAEEPVVMLPAATSK